MQYEIKFAVLLNLVISPKYQISLKYETSIQFTVFFEFRSGREFKLPSGPKSLNNLQRHVFYISEHFKGLTEATTVIKYFKKWIPRVGDFVCTGPSSSRKTWSLYHHLYLKCNCIKTTRWNAFYEFQGMLHSGLLRWAGHLIDENVQKFDVFFRRQRNRGKWVSDRLCPIWLDLMWISLRCSMLQVLASSADLGNTI